MDSATPDPNDYLMVDTQFFPPEFKSRLLSFIPDFDAQCDGLLIHSENFQALNLLQERYREQVKCIYIDPPYNAKSSEILYKNTFRDSSWLSLMENRLVQSISLLMNDGINMVAIDEVEQEVLGQLLAIVFPVSKKVCLSIVHNPRGQQGKNISYKHEFVYIIYPSDEKKYLSDLKRNEVDSRTLRDSGTESNREDAATCFYPFYVLDDKILRIGEVPNDNFHPLSNNVKLDNGTIEVWPIDDKGIEKKWRYSVSSVHTILSKLRVKKGKDGKVQIYFDQDMCVVPSFWSNARYDASEYGTKLIQALFTTQYITQNAKNLYPKSINNVFDCIQIANSDFPSSLILDFFAGSGTTAHAVINLNREDGGNRKYILVEMGDHFNTVLKPRIEKVVYSPDWKDGKPTSFDKGVSHCFKYMRLESYEDTLNNLELQESDPIAASMPPSLREDYMLHYLLDTEANASLLDIDMFKNPFGGYRLKIKRPGSEACDETPVDLIETFNYLIGLRVSQYYLPRRYSARFKRAVDLELPGEEGSRRLVLDGRPKLDDAGKWSFLRLEGVVPAHPLNPNNGQTKRVLVIWRNLTGDMEQDNAVLDWFADDLRLNDKVPEYDIVYVNGCNNLGADRKETDSYQVRLIEEEFFRKMWG